MTILPYNSLYSGGLSLKTMSEEKKIIIDEDWKSQVEAEKAAAQGHESGGDEEQDAADAAAAARGPLPPASFEILLTSLATEAMLHLGQLPHPATGQPKLDLPHAKYTIDLIEVLEEKTGGNLTPEEQAAISQILHQLRMAFVAVQAQQSEAPPAS